MRDHYGPVSRCQSARHYVGGADSLSAACSHDVDDGAGASQPPCVKPFAGVVLVGPQSQLQPHAVHFSVSLPLTLEEIILVIRVLRAEGLGLNGYERAILKSAIAKLEEDDRELRKRKTKAVPPVE